MMSKIEMRFYWSKSIFGTKYPHCELIVGKKLGYVIISDWVSMTKLIVK